MSVAAIHAGLAKLTIRAGVGLILFLTLTAHAGAQRLMLDEHRPRGVARVGLAALHAAVAAVRVVCVRVSARE
jgi:hypothetical protein